MILSDKEFRNYSRYFNDVIKDTLRIYTHNLSYKDILNNTFVDGTKIHDGNPLIHIIFPSIHKMIRVCIHDDSDDLHERYLRKHDVEYNDELYHELCIVVYIHDFSVQKCMTEIALFLKNNNTE